MSSLDFALPFATLPLAAPAVPAKPVGAVAARPVDAAERALVRAARGGEPEAFRQLVDRYRSDVVELCVRIVRSREEGEEAAQDAFVRAWRALPRFREEARFSTWLFRIATRRALDSANAVRRRRETEVAGDPESMEAPGDSPSGLAGSQQRRLWRILGGLDATPRAVVSLHYWGRHGVAEIAEILEMPEGTVKTHLHRSRNTLRAAWIRESRREDPRELQSL